MRKQWIAVTTIVLTVLAASSLAPGAARTWDAGGGGATGWATNANWDGDLIWAAGDSALFSAGTAAADMDVNASAIWINFNNAAAFDITAGGSTLTISTATGITTSDAFAYGIAAPVTLGASQTWDVFNGSTLTVSGAVGGAFAITKASAGTLVLSGVNTYTGATNINLGTVSIGAATGLGTVAGGVVFGAAGGELDFTGAFDLTEAITLTGAGTIDTNANAVTLSGVIGGAGALTKAGAAQLIVSGNSAAFTGTANVNAGSLRLTGTLGTAGATGAMTVLAAATLDGTGTYGGNLIVNGTGIVTPGSGGIGTLTIGGDYTPAATAILNVQASATPFAAPLGDILLLPAAAATATLGNSIINVTLTENVNNYPTGATTYSVVQTTGGGGAAVAGVFGTTNLPGNTAVFQYAMAYTATTADFVITRQALQNLGVTGNQRAVGTALQARIYDAGDMQNIATVLNAYPLASQVRTALDQISPASADASTSATLNTAHTFTSGLARRMDRFHSPGETLAANNTDKDQDTPQLAFAGDNNEDVLALMMQVRERRRAERAEISEGPLKFWVQQFNTWSDEDDEDGVPGFDAFTTGVTVGSDFAIGDNLAVGASIGYSGTDLDLTQSAGDADIDALRGAIYATWFQNGFYADAALAFGNNWYDNTRNINFMGRRATSDHTALEYSAYLGGGYDFPLFGMYVGPTASLQYTALDEESYNESGAGALNQRIADRTSHSLRSAVGLRVLCPIKLPNETTTLVPEFRAQWLHEYENDARDVSARFTGGGASYTVEGNNPEANSTLLGGRLTAYLSEAISLYADYELQLQSGDGQTAQTLSAGVRFAW